MAKNQKAGRLSVDQMRKLINKKAGMNVAVDLADENNATIVKEWIPTGSRWLDSIVCRGKMAGIPVGKVSEIAGLEASGKSYFGANKEELKSIAKEKDGVVDLKEEVQKQGGEMNFDQILKMHGI